MNKYVLGISPHIKEKGMSLSKKEMKEIINLSVAGSALKGYLSALDDAENINEGYRKRMQEYYIKNLDSAIKIFTDKFEEIMLDNQESKELEQKEAIRQLKVISSQIRTGCFFNRHNQEELRLEEEDAGKTIYHATATLEKQLTATQQKLDVAVETLESLPTECYNAGVAAGILKDKAGHCFNDALKHDYLERMAHFQNKFKELHKAALARIKE
jgi:hypothetical protein